MNELSGKVHAAQVAAVVTVLMLCAYALGGKTPAMRSCAQPTLEQVAMTPTPVGISATVAPGIVNDQSQTTSGRGEEEEKVRQVARDYVKQKFPGVKFDGVSAIPFLREHLYLAGVDTIQNGEHSTINLFMRSYTRRNGNSYWLPTLLSEEEAAKLRLQAVGSR